MLLKPAGRNAADSAVAAAHICFPKLVASVVTPAMASAILTRPAIASSGAFFPSPPCSSPPAAAVPVPVPPPMPPNKPSIPLREPGVSGDGDCIAHSGKHSQLDCGECGVKLVALLQKPLALAVFGVAVGFFPFSVLQQQAVAEVVTEGDIGRLRDDAGAAGHEHSVYTQKLLEKIPPLLRSIEDVKAGRGGLDDV